MDGALPSRHGHCERRLVIGLVNNMAGAAMASSYEHFAASLADTGRDFELRRLTLRHAGETPSGCVAVDDLPVEEIDAFIVTGMEPMTPDLRDEALWPRLVQLHDWCEANFIPVLWSCLSAHAAVLHHGNITRQPLPMKISGIFACAAVAPEHRLLKDMPACWSCPHSRHNGLNEAKLTASGYTLLSRAGPAGVDIFTRADGIPFFFFQGHPEYRPDTLLREYIRDARRFIGGDYASPPLVPSGYLEPKIEHLLSESCEQRRGDALDGTLLTLRAIRAEWREARRLLFANWLEIAAEHACGVATMPGIPDDNRNTSNLAREARA